MSVDLSAWLSQIPWGPLALVLAVGAFWQFQSRQSQRRKRTLRAALDAGATVVDVRTKAEYAGGYYPGAINLPADTIASQTKRLGAADHPVIVYCASGGRSARAAAILRSTGFSRVIDAGALTNLPR